MTSLPDRADNEDHHRVADLQARISRMATEINSLQSQLSLASAASDQSTQRLLGKIVLRAQCAADRAVEEGRQEGERLVAAARHRADGLVAEAQRMSQRLIESAREERTALLDAAPRDVARDLPDRTWPAGGPEPSGRHPAGSSRPAPAFTTTWVASGDVVAARPVPSVGFDPAPAHPSDASFDQHPPPPTGEPVIPLAEDEEFRASEQSPTSAPPPRTRRRVFGR